MSPYFIYFAMRELLVEKSSAYLPVVNSCRIRTLDKSAIKQPIGLKNTYEN
jgi:hypothetical protein